MGDSPDVDINLDEMNSITDASLPGMDLM